MLINLYMLKKPNLDYESTYKYCYTVQPLSDFKEVYMDYSPIMCNEVINDSLKAKIIETDTEVINCIKLFAQAYIGDDEAKQSLDTILNHAISNKKEVICEVVKVIDKKENLTESVSDKLTESSENEDINDFIIIWNKYTGNERSYKDNETVKFTGTDTEFLKFLQNNDVFVDAEYCFNENGERKVSLKTYFWDYEMSASFFEETVLIKVIRNGKEIFKFDQVFYHHYIDPDFEDTVNYHSLEWYQKNQKKQKSEPTLDDYEKILTAIVDNDRINYDEIDDENDYKLNYEIEIIDSDENDGECPYLSGYATTDSEIDIDFDRSDLSDDELWLTGWGGFVQNTEEGPFKSFKDMDIKCYDNEKGGEYNLPEIPKNIQKEFLQKVNKWIEENK